MERYIDHSGTGAAPTVYERGKPPGGTVVMTENVWIKKVPAARVSMVEDANTLRQANSVARNHGFEVHHLEVKKTRENNDGTVDVQIAATAESGSSNGMGLAWWVIPVVLASIVGTAAVVPTVVDRWRDWMDPDAPPDPGIGGLNILSWVVPIGVSMWFAGKAGFSPYVGGAAAAAGVWLWQGYSKRK